MLPDSFLPLGKQLLFVLKQNAYICKIKRMCTKCKCICDAPEPVTTQATTTSTRPSSATPSVKEEKVQATQKEGGKTLLDDGALLRQLFAHLGGRV